MENLIETAIGYLHTQKLTKDALKCVYAGPVYFVMADSENEFTFNSAGQLVATNE